MFTFKCLIKSQIKISYQAIGRLIHFRLVGEVPLKLASLLCASSIARFSNKFVPCIIPERSFAPYKTNVTKKYN